MNFDLKSDNKKLICNTDLFYIDILKIAHTFNQDSKIYSHGNLNKHPYFEICYVLNGNCEFELYNEKKFTVTKNSFIIIPPTCEHRIIKESENFSKIFSFFTFIPKENKDNNFYKSARIAINDIKLYKSNKILKFYINQFIKLFRNAENCDCDTLITTNFISFIIEIFEIITKNNKTSPQYIHNDQRINDAIFYIRKNITEAITVEDVAKSVNISSKQLTRLFRSFLSTTPGEYIKNIKIKKIKHLLMDMDYTLSDIAEIMKYNDASALIKFIKKNEGITPQKIRENIFKLQ